MSANNKVKKSVFTYNADVLDIPVSFTFNSGGQPVASGITDAGTVAGVQRYAVGKFHVTFSQVHKAMLNANGNVQTTSGTPKGYILSFGVYSGSNASQDKGIVSVYVHDVTASAATALVDPENNTTAFLNFKFKNGNQIDGTGL